MLSDGVLRFPAGVSAQDAEAYQAEYDTWRKHETARRRQARLSSLPIRLQMETEKAQETPAVAAAREFVASGETFLILAGAVGTGKSVAAAIAYLEFDCPIGASKYTKAYDYSMHGLYGEKNDTFWRTVRDAELLVIDDLGTETRDGKGFAASQLEALLDYRYDAVRKTIMTTNLTADQFKAAYCQGSGVRLLDRIRETGSFVKVAGESMRKKPEAK